MDLARPIRPLSEARRREALERNRGGGAGVGPRRRAGPAAGPVALGGVAPGDAIGGPAPPMDGGRRCLGAGLAAGGCGPAHGADRERRLPAARAAGADAARDRPPRYRFGTALVPLLLATSRDSSQSSAMLAKRIGFV
jgi:hypothetical protein